MTIFEKIIKGEIPSYKIYEDALVYSFLDANPHGKGHILVVPKEPFVTLDEIPDEVLQHMILVVKNIAKNTKDVLNVSGYNIVMNNGEIADQAVPHAHIHIIPRYEENNLYMKHKDLELLPEDFKDLQEKLSF